MLILTAILYFFGWIFIVVLALVIEFAVRVGQRPVAVPPRIPTVPEAEDQSAIDPCEIQAVVLSLSRELGMTRMAARGLVAEVLAEHPEFTTAEEILPAVIAEFGNERR